ncbi:hypothetical protein [Microbulbifer sp. THAF38]|uniref:hypothetical protein n=1 Tax=Microbulbifer sp. THAF38 TaxID=2587856 RepID=UPI00126902CF|nr:hypothetical protein [Microbulbifer sp. THAF38]QFT56594.1 hypothetical protein FIU95_18765 [Microbulbifer sp. THAF38]
MQLTIMATEGLVTVDGNTLEMDLADYTMLDAIHAVQFDGVEGEIEWQDPNRPNDPILTLDAFQQVITDHANQWALLQVDNRSDEQRRIDALISIDHFAGQIRAKLLGVGEFIQEERRRAYEVALAYEADGFPESVPLAVQVQMETFNQTATEAVAEIKNHHDAWLKALDQIRNLRLHGKAQILDLAKGSDYEAQAQQTIDELSALATS